MSDCQTLQCGTRPPPNVLNLNQDLDAGSDGGEDDLLDDCDSIQPRVNFVDVAKRSSAIRCDSHPNCMLNANTTLLVKAARLRGFRPHRKHLWAAESPHGLAWNHDTWRYHP